MRLILDVVDAESSAGRGRAGRTVADPRPRAGQLLEERPLARLLRLDAAPAPGRGRVDPVVEPAPGEAAEDPGSRRILARGAAARKGRDLHHGPGDDHPRGAAAGADPRRLGYNRGRWAKSRSSASRSTSAATGAAWTWVPV